MKVFHIVFIQSQSLFSIPKSFGAKDLILRSNTLSSKIILIDSRYTIVKNLPK